MTSHPRYENIQEVSSEVQSSIDQESQVHPKVTEEPPSEQLPQKRFFSKLHFKVILFLVVALGFFCGIFFAFQEKHSPKKVPFGEFQEEDNRITLHIIPHYQVTPEQANIANSYQERQDHACPQCSLNDVLTSLEENEERTLIMAEIGLFQHWWAQANQTDRERAKRLVDNKQLEFVNGGWVTNDEACAYYDDIIDQFILGNRFLAENLNFYPHQAWQINSYGHSKSQASIMQDFGYESISFDRIDFNDKNKRINKSKLQFYWKVPQPRTIEAKIIGNILMTDFQDISTFECQSQVCESLQDQNLTGHSLLEFQIRNLAMKYPTKQLPFFVNHWNDSAFLQIDDAIEYFNKNKELNITIKFSTLTYYVHHLQHSLKGKKDQLAVKKGDFFPYIQTENAAWTGFFANEPMFKLLVRDYSRYLATAKMFLCQALLADQGQISFNQYSKAVHILEEAVASTQNHAIAGTLSFQAQKEYEFRLKKGKRNLDELIEDYFKGQLIHDTMFGKEDEKFQDGYPQLLDIWQPTLQSNINVTILNAAQSTIILKVYNPDQARKRLIEFQVPNSRYEVYYRGTKAMQSDVICNQFQGEKRCILAFAGLLKGYGFSYFILKQMSESRSIKEEILTENTQKFIPLSRESYMRLNILNNSKEFAIQICDKEEYCISDSLEIDYQYYESQVSTEDSEKQPDSDYIFRPKSPQKQEYEPIQNISFFKGSYLTVIKITRQTMFSLIRVHNYDYKNAIELQSFLFEPTRSSNIVIQFKSKNSANSKTNWWTDSNGYFMQERRKDFRLDYQSTTNLSVSDDYYPITSAAYIQNSMSEHRMTIMTDRAQGCTSLEPGQLEIMIWRSRSEENHKDGKANIQTSHWIILSNNRKISPDRQREIQLQLDRAVQMWFFDSGLEDQQNEIRIRETEFFEPFEAFFLSGIKISLNSYEENTLIVRVQNMDLINKLLIICDEDYDESMMHSNFLKTILKSYNQRVYVKKVTELMLNEVKKASERYTNILEGGYIDMRSNDVCQVRLNYLEMKTFKFEL